MTTTTTIITIASQPGTSRRIASHLTFSLYFLGHEPISAGYLPGGRAVIGIPGVGGCTPTGEGCTDVLLNITIAITTTTTTKTTTTANQAGIALCIVPTSSHRSRFNLWKALPILRYRLTGIPPLTCRPRWFILPTAAVVTRVVTHPFPGRVNGVFREFPLDMPVKVSVGGTTKVGRQEAIPRPISQRGMAPDRSVSNAALTDNNLLSWLLDVRDANPVAGATAAAEAVIHAIGAPDVTPLGWLSSLPIAPVLSERHMLCCGADKNLLVTNIRLGHNPPSEIPSRPTTVSLTGVQWVRAGVACSGDREGFIVILRILLERLHDVSDITQTRRLPRLFPCLAEHRKQNGC